MRRNSASGRYISFRTVRRSGFSAVGSKRWMAVGRSLFGSARCVLIRGHNRMEQAMTTCHEQFSLTPPGQLSIAVRTRGRTTLIELTGEWDLVGTPEVRHAVDHVLSDQPECLVLDLSGLSFIDSSGLHGTVGIDRHCSAQGVRLVIIPGSPAVQRPFQI